MNYRGFFQIVVSCCSVLLVALLLGCTHTQGGGSAKVPDWSDPGTVTPLINTTYQPGDKIIIDFADNPGVPPSWPQTIREDGMITLPLNQTIRAAGLKKGELETAIRDLYVDRILKRLTVNIRAEQRSYFVDGEVRTPGQKDHTGLITAMSAITAAGGFTDFADRSEVTITRRSTGEKIQMNGKKAQRDASYDVPVYPGDRVTVNRRFF